MQSNDYVSFLESKADVVQSNPVIHGEIHSALKGFQVDCVRFALARGCAAFFADTGLGKTVMQCEWARNIPGKVLILAPLAVARQTVNEAAKLLGMTINYSRDGTVNSQFTITNYERVHLFDLSQFSGVVLDESSILKSFMGKTKQFLCDSFKDTPYKLCCTATPAPNDYMELGNHSEFLGIMPGTEMLTRWFINDPSQVGNYRLKKHAVKGFWEWVSSWAACISKPSDLGYPNDGYNLPALHIKTHTVETGLVDGSDGFLFDTSKFGKVSSMELHKWKRHSVEDRVNMIAEMVNKSDLPWIVWCESNQESDLLSKAIPDAVEVKGSDSMDAKEERLAAFADGSARVIVSKPSICGFGLNWQHCNNIAFASISYSYEKFYQAVRRSWRFGQKKEVNVHVVIADAELLVWRAIEEKATNHDQMKEEMKYAVFKKGIESVVNVDYNPTHKARLPNWLEVGT